LIRNFTFSSLGVVVVVVAVVDDDAVVEVHVLTKVSKNYNTYFF